MNIETLSLTYEYNPYRSQEGREIPAFEIVDATGTKVAETNEHLPADNQETLAALFAAAPELLQVMKQAGGVDWVCNAALTDDIEALRRICLQYSAWWNERALPAIRRAQGQLEAMPKGRPIPVIIVMEGGIVQNTYTPDPQFKLEPIVVDYDCEEGGIDGLEELIEALERAEAVEHRSGFQPSITSTLDEKRALLARWREEKAQ